MSETNAQRSTSAPFLDDAITGFAERCQRAISADRTVTLTSLQKEIEGLSRMTPDIRYVRSVSIPIFTDDENGELLIRSEVLSLIQAKIDEVGK